MSFVDDYINGYAFSEDIHTHIDKWHEDENIREELHEYLGMTWEEYVEWVNNPSDLRSILSLRMIPDNE